MSTPDDLVFLLDVDDTLLDNDRFGDDLAARLERDFGASERDRYHALYEARRDEVGYADYLGALQAFRNGNDREDQLLQMSGFLLDYPFAERLYPRALEAIAHLRTLGRSRHRMQLVAVEGAAERVLADYTFDHSPS